MRKSTGWWIVGVLAGVVGVLTYLRRREEERRDHDVEVLADSIQERLHRLEERLPPAP